MLKSAIAFTASLRFSSAEAASSVAGVSASDGGLGMGKKTPGGQVTIIEFAVWSAGARRCRSRWPRIIGFLKEGWFKEREGTRDPHRKP